MPRIADAEIARLKQAVPLTRLAEARGVALSGQGHNLIGLCPFHDDRSPSLVIDPGKNLWHCLGACAAGGSAIDWVMRDHGVPFRVACEILAGMAGGAPYPARPAGAPATGALSATSARRLANPLSADVEGDALLGQVAEFYHRTLVDSPLATSADAAAYLAARKISQEAIRHFHIGFADRSLGLRVPDKARREGAALRARLARVGVLKESGHELMSGAVVMPIADEAGATVGMYGRMIGRALRAGTPVHRYLPGPHRAAWNAGGALTAAAAADGALIVCEAIIDALSFWCAGFANVTAAYGVNGFTEHHRRLCTADAVRTVFIAYDADAAGDGAAGALADELIAAGRSVYRVRFPAEATDANALVCASDDPASALRAVLADAVFLGGAAHISVPALARGDASVATRAMTPATTRPPAGAVVATPASAARAVSSPLAARSASPVGVAMLAPSPALPVTASPMRSAAPAVSAPVSALPSPVLCQDGDDHRAVIGARVYRVRGLLRNADPAVLKVGLRLTVDAGADGAGPFHQDTVDLCQAKQRAAFLAAAVDATAADYEAIKADLGRLLDWCEQAVAAHRRASSGPKGPQRPTLSAEDEAAARAFLAAPDLLARIAADYEACGIVGDDGPKLVAYLCAISRKLEQPLAVLTMAPSAAGKTSLQDGTLRFVPDEDQLCVSAMTGQALHYIEEDLSHRVLAIAEEEGASRAAYSLKLLQSEGKLRLAAPVKDPETGEIATKIREVRGPVALFLTSTAVQLDEELSNRCLVLTVDESAEQTARVHAAQRDRETLPGLMRRSQAAAIRTLHQNAQRLLEQVAIVNPFAPFLSFRCDRPRTRRDHTKYLCLIRTIAFLHQHQRPRRQAVIDGKALDYIEVTLADIAAANALAAAVLGRSLDELAPQTRTLLVALDALVTRLAAAQAIARERVRLTRRQIREALGLSVNQVRDHLGRLVELEYVQQVRGEGSGQRTEYALAYDGQGKAGEPFVLGLVDVATIRAQVAAAGGPAAPAAAGTGTTALESAVTGTSPTWSPQTPNLVPTWSGSGPHLVRGLSPHENETDGGENRCSSNNSTDSEFFEGQGGISKPPSHRSQSRSPADADRALAAAGDAAAAGAA